MIRNNIFASILTLFRRAALKRGEPRPEAHRLDRCTRICLEQLEIKLLPAVIAVFDSNLLQLQVTATADDSITIGADALGNVMVNGSTVTASLALAKAADVQRIVVNSIPELDAPGANLINLTGVTKAAFSGLTDGNVIVDGAAGADTILGSQFADIIAGDADNDSIDGGFGADTIHGNDGNDTVIAATAAGSDSVDGDLGNDVVHFNGSISADSLTILPAGSRFRVNGGSQTVNAGGIEQLEVFSGSGNDTITVEDLTGVLDLSWLLIASEAGADVVDAAALTSGVLTLSVDGGSDSDLILGSAGADSLVGNAGNDTIFGNNGSDFINGMDGTDEVHGGAGQDYMLGGASSDLMFGDDGNDMVRGQGGSDTLSGGLGDDWIDGEEGNNVLLESGDVNFVLNDSQLRGLGTDQLSGMSYLAMLTGGNGANRIDARNFSGRVSLSGGAGNDTLLGTGNDDTLIGGSGNDVLAGYGGQDLLNGNDGQDTIFGGAGNDTLYGGADADVLLGEDGDDRLMGQGSSNDTLNGGPGTDSYDSTTEIDESFTLNLNDLIGP